MVIRMVRRIARRWSRSRQSARNISGYLTAASSACGLFPCLTGSQEGRLDRGRCAHAHAVHTDTFTVTISPGRERVDVLARDALLVACSHEAQVRREERHVNCLRRSGVSGVVSAHTVAKSPDARKPRRGRI